MCQEALRYQSTEGPCLCKTLSWPTQLKVFLRFCPFFGYLVIPGATQTIVRYCVFLARNHTASNVGQYFNVIRILHLGNGSPNPLENNFAVHSILRGIDRIRSHAQMEATDNTSAVDCFMISLILKVKLTSFSSQLVWWGSSLSWRNQRYYPPRLPGTIMNTIYAGEMFCFPMMMHAYQFDTQKLSNAMHVYYASPCCQTPVNYARSEPFVICGRLLSRATPDSSLVLILRPRAGALFEVPYFCGSCSTIDRILWPQSWWLQWAFVPKRWLHLGLATRGLSSDYHETGRLAIMQLDELCWHSFPLMMASGKTYVQ